MLKGLLAWSDLRDTGGRRVSDYELTFDYGFIDWDGKLMGMGATFLWSFFMFMSTVSATIMSWVSDPSWLDGVTDAYEDLTRSLFSVVNPIYIAVMTFVILMVIILAGKAKSVSSRLSKEDINRITAGMGIMLVVCILVANPFALLRTALSLAQTIIDIITGGDAASAVSVDALIRQPTLLITYGHGVTESCANTWSRGGTEAAATCAGSEATASEATVLVSFLALMLSSAALTFALVALWKFIVHLSVAIIAIIVIPWVAASTITKRRQFDGFARHGVTIGAHLLMAIIVQVISIAGPTIMASVLGNWGTDDWAILQMLLLMVSWVFLTGFLFFVTRRKGALSRTLKTDAHATLTSLLGGSSTVNNALNKVDVQGRSPLRNARNPIPKGKAAQLLSVAVGASKNGKPVQDDVTDAQRHITINSPRAIEYRLTDGKVDRRVVTPDAPALTSGTGRVGKMVSAMRRGREALKYVSAETVLARAAEAERARLESAGETVNGSVPSTPQPIPVNFTTEDVKSLSREVVSSQRESDTPMFGGRSPRTSVEAAILAEIEDTVRKAREIGQVAHVRVDRVDSSGAVVEKLSAADLHRSLRESRTRRGSAEASLLNGGSVRDDDDSVRLTVNYSAAKSGSGDDSRAMRIWRQVRRRAVDAGRNALLGSPATRGDVRDGWSNRDTERAYEEVDRYHAVQKIRAIGGSPNSRVDIDPTSSALAVEATPNSPYGPVSSRYGLGFGDRID